MNSFKKLAGDTAIYGTTSILGRILGWGLSPYWGHIFAPETYAIVTNLYAYVAFFVVFLLYGMETAYFRYASRSDQPEAVYSTSLITLFFTSSVFVLLAATFSGNIATLMDYGSHPEYITWFALILGMDALTAIPFARLRINNRPIKFAALKMAGIGANIFFNIFFLTFLPWWIEKNPDSVLRIFYSAEMGVGYVFIANLLSSGITLLLLFPEFFKITLYFDKILLKRMLNYGFPILIVGLAGVVNQNIDKILIPFLVAEENNPMYQLGIYGQNYKLAVLMNMFIQAFRYAFEPFFFSQKSTENDKSMYAIIMKYFVIFGLFIFLGMVLYIDVVKIIINKTYWEGLKVVPIVLMANLFLGIYFTLSLWYKLTDKTRYGAYIAIVGSLITVALNFALVPVFGYMGSAFAALVCFVVMVLISYWLGQKHFPVNYPLKRIAVYFVLALALYLLSLFTGNFHPVLKYSIHSFMMFVFLAMVYNLEKTALQRLFKINKKK